MCTKYEVSMSNHVPVGGVHRWQHRCQCRMMPMMTTDKAWLYKALWLKNQVSQKLMASSGLNNSPERSGHISIREKKMSKQLLESCCCRLKSVSSNSRTFSDFCLRNFSHFQGFLTYTCRTNWLTLTTFIGAPGFQMRRFFLTDLLPSLLSVCA